MGKGQLFSQVGKRRGWKTGTNDKEGRGKVQGKVSETGGRPRKIVGRAQGGEEHDKKKGK